MSLNEIEGCENFWLTSSTCRCLLSLVGLGVVDFLWGGLLLVEYKFIEAVVFATLNRLEFGTALDLAVKIVLKKKKNYDFKD